jgi:acyl-coenzyme A synthetase/AMP-(fatty) acid ligase
LGEVPVAVVEPYPDAPLIDPAELRAFAKKHLTSYEVPTHFHFVERLPRTVSDKINRPEVHKMLDRLANESKWRGETTG